MQGLEHVMQRGGVSFWYKELGGLPKPRPALAANIIADVCIIGAGYTGLWTAYYLKKADPSLNIVIVGKTLRALVRPVAMGGGCLETLLGTTRNISALERLIRSKPWLPIFTPVLMRLSQL